VVRPRQCPVTLSVKVVEQDKHKMVQALHSRQKGSTNNHVSGGSSVKTDLNRPQQAEDERGWITFDKPLLYVYAGQGPYVGRYVSLFSSTTLVFIHRSDLMAFPVSLPDDGMSDVVA
jgi:sphingosine kinase